MRFPALCAVVTMLAACGGREPQAVSIETADQPRSVDSVTVSFDMVEPGLEWLELAASGTDDAKLREVFFRDVAPTSGCQAIIHHWQRSARMLPSISPGIRAGF